MSPEEAHPLQRGPTRHAGWASIPGVFGVGFGDYCNQSLAQTQRRPVVSPSSGAEFEKLAPVGGRYVQVDSMEWAPFPEALSDGPIRWKLLNVSPEMGAWTAIFDCPAGSSFARHVHIGPGEYFFIKGKMTVRGGDEEGGSTADRSRVRLRGMQRSPRPDLLPGRQPVLHDLPGPIELH